LTAKANRTTGDDGDAAFEIEQVCAAHVASHGAQLLLTSNNMQVYIICSLLTLLAAAKRILVQPPSFLRNSHDAWLAEPSAV
jgi:hypothetical protein